MEFLKEAFKFEVIMMIGFLYAGLCMLLPEKKSGEK